MQKTVTRKKKKLGKHYRNRAYQKLREKARKKFKRDRTEKRYL
jgi:hypothetical protein